MILMEDYRPKDVTEKVKETLRDPQASDKYNRPRRRIFLGIRGLIKVKTSGFKISAKYQDGTVFELDLTNNPRIVEKTQVNMIARIIESLKRPERSMHVKELAQWIDESFKEKGFKAFSNPVPPDLAAVAGIDVAWTLNRLYNASFYQE